MECSDDVKRLLAGLGIALEFLAARCLEFHPEAGELVIAETDDTAASTGSSRRRRGPGMP